MKVDIESKDNCTFVKVEAGDLISHQDINNLFKNIQNLDASVFKDKRWLVLLLPNIKNVEDNFFSVICRISAYVEQYNLKFSIIAPDPICKLIKSDRINQLVFSSASLDDFYKNHIIDDKQGLTIFVNSLLESTAMTMKALLDLKSIKNQVEVISGGGVSSQIEVGAIAGIVSGYFLGNVIIGFPLDVFKKAMSRFLLMEVVAITPEVKDGAAELLNVIIGQTKTKLNEMGFGISQVIPSVIVGEKIEISSVGKQTWICIKFTTEIGEFSIFLSANTPLVAST